MYAYDGEGGRLLNIFDYAFEQWEFNRQLTAKLLKEISEQENPQAILEWAPGPGRATIGWQILHIAVTEELFAKDRLKDTGEKVNWPELVENFRGGSTPGFQVPSLREIREILELSRENLIKTMKTFTEDDLSMIPEPIKERGWNLRMILGIVAWHEPHHQGQAHLTFNLWKAQK